MTSATRPRPSLAEPAVDTDEPVSLRRIAGLFRPHRVPLTALFALIVVQAGLGVVSPFLLREILDDALPHRDTLLISLLAAGMIVCAVGSGSLGVATTGLSNTIGQRVMNELRVSVYGHLQRMSLGFFTRTKSGEVLSRVFNDIGGVDNVITTTAGSMVQNATTTIAITVALIVLDWQLALLSLIVVPLFLLFTLRLGKRRRNLARGRTRRMARLTTMVEESLSVTGVLLAKTMGNERAMRERFGAESREIATLERAAALAGRWQIASRGMSLTVIPALVYWIAGLALAGGASPISLGTVVAFTSMLNRLVAPASAMQTIGQNVATSKALFGRIFEVLDLQVEISDKPDAGTLEVRRGDVAMRGVSFRYDEDGPLTLADIDLDVPAGTTTALVGSTGSGKTTLAYLVARLYEVSERIRGDRRHRRPRRDARLARRRRRDGVAGDVPVPRHRAGEPAVREAGRDRRGDRSRREGRAHPRHPRRAARGLRHRRRPARLPLLRRREAADGDRPDPAAQPAGAHPRRGDQRARHPHRALGAGRARPARPRAAPR